MGIRSSHLCHLGRSRAPDQISGGQCTHLACRRVGRKSHSAPRGRTGFRRLRSCVASPPPTRGEGPSAYPGFLKLARGVRPLSPEPRAPKASLEKGGGFGNPRHDRPEEAACPVLTESTGGDRISGPYGIVAYNTRPLAPICQDVFLFAGAERSRFFVLGW